MAKMHFGTLIHIVRSFLIINFVLFNFCVFAQASSLQEELSSFELENGMRVIAINDQRAPVANHTIWYRVGAVDDPVGKSGLAHFLEHLMFKGTGRLVDGEYRKTIELMGGSNNAGTTQDYTVYYARVASDNLEKVMELEAERLKGLKLDIEAVSRERDVILEERRQRVDSKPGSQFNEQLATTLYLHHPYGKPTIGWFHEMETLGLQDVLQFYEQFYAPNNAILVISGDVDSDVVLEFAQRHYGPIAPNPDLDKHVTLLEPPHLAERRLVMIDERVSNPLLLRQYIAPNIYMGDLRKAAALSLLSEILGSGKLSSVLGRELQLEDDSAVYTSVNFSGTYNNPQTLSIYAVPNQGVDLEYLEDRMDTILDNFLVEGVDPDDFARIKKQLKYSRILAQDNSMSVAMRYGRGLVSGLNLEEIAKWPELLQSISKDEVLNVAIELFDKKRSVTGWLLKSEID